MNRSHMLGLIAIFSTSVFWGLSFVSIKITVAVLPPMTLALFRFIIASATLMIILKKLEPDTRLLRGDVPVMAVSGLLGVTAYYYFQNTGVKLTTASAASMILASIPILTVVGEFLLFKTKLSVMKIISVILSVGGVYFVAAFSQQESVDSLLGNLFMIGAAITWVAYTLITRPLSERYSQLAIVTYQFLFGTAALIPFSFFESWQWQAIDSVIIFHLIYLGLFCSALANYLYVYAMGILGVSSAALFINVIPVVAVFSGFIILQEQVNVWQILGGTAILFSVYLANCDSAAAVFTKLKFFSD